MDLSIIGSGYVGLVTGACFADVGHNVICVDNDPRKIESLTRGKVPIYEPGLEEIIHRNVSAKRLRFTGSIKEGVDNAEVVFIAVPTPQGDDGSVDLSFIEKVAREIAGVLTDYRVIVDKSTVPVKTGEKVAESIKRYNKHGAAFDVVSNPEFLREGCAVADLMKPDRIVIGAQSSRAIDLMKKVYEPFMAPILVTDINSAELIKHAANSFLALKISYINAVSAICEASGADVEKVADGIGMDRRIGRNFLNAGIGYGGSCFPKDIAAFITISEQLGVPFTLLKEVQRINATQKDRFLKAVRDALWVLRDKKIAVWGLTFKPDTDDIRSSVAIDLVADMLKEGAQVSAYDPKGMEKAREVKSIAGARLTNTAMEALDDAEALIIATEWAEFANVDLAAVKEKMHTPMIFDGRNLYDPETMQKLGFHYTSIGRPRTKSA
ncbi:MAG TPA: UDP-glucose/GDP-mannose dehydrogenase family protein [Chthoniobacterales bacterium]|nr:UDP-glucose/GDP-mannose dehydrogenase family protein [Chthoniobacterales bacterium]